MGNTFIAVVVANSQQYMGIFTPKDMVYCRKYHIIYEYSSS